MSEAVHEMMRSKTLKTNEARGILESAEAANRSMTPQERTRFEALTDEVGSLTTRIDARNRLAGIESRSSTGNGERRGGMLPHEVAGKHQYSLLRAMRQLADGKHALDGLEKETSDEIAHRMGRNPRGFYVPLSLPTEERVESRVGILNTTTGTGAVPTILSTNFIDLLRNRLVVRQAGATVLTDLFGNFSLPRQSQAGTMYWVAEGASPAASNQVIDQVPFSPKTAGAFTDYTRRFLEQTTLDAEMFVRQDLAAVVARGIDSAALTGTGTGNQPLGVMNTPGIATVAIGANGGTGTWAAAVALESQVAIANADIGTLGYVTNAAVRGSFKTTPKIGATFPVFLWGDDGRVNGYPVYVSNAVPSNLTKGTGTNLSALIFGNWADLVMAFWSGMDVIVDPYTGSTSGSVRIVVLQDVDINVRHPQSFAITNDLTTL